MTPEEGAAASVYCGGCGTALDEDAKFCSSCGIDQARFANPDLDPPQAADPAPAPGAARAEAPAAVVSELAPPTSADAISAPSPADAAARKSPLTAPWRTPSGARRSVAWIYYALITVGIVILGSHQPSVLPVAIVTGLYSAYLFRGGRFVIWFW